MKKYEIKSEVKTFKRHTTYFNYLIKDNVILCFSKKEGFNMKVYFNKNVKESIAQLRNYKEFKVLNYVKL